jgi:putative salt-induced outer membrane protein YdiY
VCGGVLLIWPLFAGQVEMKNGDRLTGAIEKYDGKNLVMKSEFAGTVTIPWDAVTSISSETPLYVGLKDGEVIVGEVTTVKNEFEVNTKETGKVTSPRQAVEFIRSKAEQTAYETQIERYQHPRIVDLWTGHVDFGLATSQGNVNTTSLNVTANASRSTSRDKIAVYFTSLFAKSDASGESLVTANARRGGITYSLNVNSRLFAFGTIDLDYDEFQDLDLRFAPAGGLGYRLVKTDKMRFDLNGGASLNREFFSTGLDRTSGEALLGQEFNYDLSEKTSLTEKFVLFPNLTDTGAYRMNLDTSATTALLRWLAWQFTVSDRFLSDPVAGRKKNDILFTTGFRITFQK